MARRKIEGMIIVLEEIQSSRRNTIHPLASGIKIDSHYSIRLGRIQLVLQNIISKVLPCDKKP